MFRNYFLTAYRILMKTKVYFTINTLGLAIGMSSFFLIMHYVQYQLSYDRFHPDFHRIYRLRYERTTEDGQAVRFASCCPPAGGLIRDNYPEVERVGRIYRYRASVSRGDIKFLEDRMYFAETEIFDILRFNFVEGDVKTGIREPNSAFISRSTVRKYFDEENPIGKTFSVDKKVDYQVQGIFEDVPANSHLKVDILLSYQNLVTMYGQEFQEAWGHTGMYTYLKLRPDADIGRLKGKLADLVQAEFGHVLAEYHMKMELKPQRLSDIHLTSHFMQEVETNGNRDSVRILFMIAIFIMIMAWVNYTNLSTARSLLRAKEVGLRKVVGATRKQLLLQFFFENTLINLGALAVALMLVSLALPFFGPMTGTPNSYHMWAESWFWTSVCGLLLAGIFLSGFYPVAVLTSYKPVTVLRGKMGTAAGGFNLRKALVVFQFVIALSLISGTLTVFRQIRFMRNQDLGFDIEQILVVKAPRVRDDVYGEKFLTYKETLLRNKDITSVCHATEVPGRQIYWDAGAIRRAGEDANKGKNYQIVGIDQDFVGLFNMKIVAGRNFSITFPTDEQALILNETAVRVMGFKSIEDAVGQQVDYWGNFFTVIGVMKDYHQQSLKEAFEPHIYRYMPTGRDIRGVFAIKLKGRNLRDIVRFVQERYDEFFPGNPFNYFFLDSYYDQQYQADWLLGKVFGLFSGLAVSIAVLGVLGLSSFNTSQRTKEIGLRKVLGASVIRIVFFLNRDFLILIALSFIIAVPMLIFGLDYFLGQYAFRIRLEADIFITPLIILTFVTLSIVSTQILKAATSNPVETLKYE